MFDAEGRLTRPWIIFFERISRSSVIGWDLQDCTVGTDVADPVIPTLGGEIAYCGVRVKTSDAGTPLEIDIRNNGTSVFETKPLIAAAHADRDVIQFTDFVHDASARPAPLVIAPHDDLVIDVVQGTGYWWVCVYLVYDLLRLKATG
jgi:hypothetical protein